MRATNPQHRYTPVSVLSEFLQFDINGSTSSNAAPTKLASSLPLTKTSPHCILHRISSSPPPSSTPSNQSIAHSQRAPTCPSFIRVPSKSLFLQILFANEFQAVLCYQKLLKRHF
ncbi:hypothetical protein TWF102_010279 [Orbilia oligospora]|uniref:Uncharacterized protein n=1 Tax=Orbilia oligospora TaxID=2813651 RepID=A0A7C8N7U1_ORBOL|nr:hypothetical protein TWF102_010279 [Orbilia oligospora]KAF3108875.1 hypothetical protein TWF103_005463 [Orbilia oligospora]